MDLNISFTEYNPVMSYEMLFCYLCRTFIKTNMKLVAILFLSGLIALSCKPKQNDSTPEVKTPVLPANADINTYEAEIMKIHDEAMPKMTDLNQLETRLRNMRIKATQGDQGSAALPEGIDNLIAAVKAAQNGMLDWMEYYSAMRAKLQQDVMLEFMKRELEKVTQVKDNMINTIDRANKWLAEHPDK
jgi:hypothetical protein